MSYRNKIVKVAVRSMLKNTLALHSFLYKLSSKLSIIYNNGVHPKHSIIKYKEWFNDNICEEDVVLDVGCSYGSMSYSLAKKAGFVYGIEIEKSKINEAIKNNASHNVTYICADATSFDYESLLPISCIALSNVLEHIEFREEFLTRLIKNVKWKKGVDKKLLIRVPLIDREWIVEYKKHLNLEYRLDKTHYIEYTRTTFVEEVTSCGINIISLDVRYGEIYAVCHIY